jgi:hypothetical protein
VLIKMKPDFQGSLPSVGRAVQDHFPT